jgi:hypothetical protein
MDSKEFFPPKCGLTQTDLIKLHSLLLSTLSDKESTWKDEYKAECDFIFELAYYHLEKMWKINYISEILKIYIKNPLRFFFYPAEGKSHSDFIMDKEHLTSSNFDEILELISFIEQKSQNMQTNLFLIQHCLTMGAELSGSVYLLLDFLFSDYIPFVKNILYYSIAKSCITKKLTGKELYATVKNYCEKFSINVLKTRYKIPTTLNFSIKKADTSSLFTAEILVRSSKILYPEPDLTSQKNAPTVEAIRKNIMEVNKVFDSVNYDPEIFKDLNHLNQINSQLLKE